MGYVRKTDAGTWKACWRDATGRQPSKTFDTRREANAFLATIEAAKNTGTYVDPHAARRIKFVSYAADWAESHNVELTTRARDLSLLKNHVVGHWGSVPLSAIDHSSVQKWVTSLSRQLSPSTVAECHRLFSTVLRAAMRDRLIAMNPAKDVRLPKKRQTAGDRQTISREEFTERLLPAIPERHRALVALAGGTGLRWGECVGLRWESIDTAAGTIRVERVAVEVNGHVTPKPYPKSRAGRRVVPLPSMVRHLLEQYRELYGTGQAGEVFINEAGTPLRRTLFRARIWRPSLVRAGLLGCVAEESDKFRGSWPTPAGDESELFKTRAQAVKAVSRRADGGLRFHDLRHSYASWLITSGVPVPDVQRVMGHERPTTTLMIYTHVQGGSQERVLGALAAFSLPDEG